MDKLSIWKNKNLYAESISIAWISRNLCYMHYYTIFISLSDSLFLHNYKQLVLLFLFKISTHIIEYIRKKTIGMAIPIKSKDSLLVKISIRISILSIRP